MVEDKVKSEPTLGSDHSRSEDAKAMVFRFGKHEMCPTLEVKKYIEFWRYPVMPLLYLEKDDLERADDQ